MGTLPVKGEMGLFETSLSRVWQCLGIVCSGVQGERSCCGQPQSQRGDGVVLDRRQQTRQLDLSADTLPPPFPILPCIPPSSPTCICVLFLFHPPSLTPAPSRYHLVCQLQLSQTPFPSHHHLPVDVPSFPPSLPNLPCPTPSLLGAGSLSVRQRVPLGRSI